MVQLTSGQLYAFLAGVILAVGGLLGYQEITQESEANAPTCTPEIQITSPQRGTRQELQDGTTITRTLCP